MKNLHLAATATQHAAQFHASAAEIRDIRGVGLVFGAVCVIGLIRTVVGGHAHRSARAANAADAAERQRLYDAQDRYAA